MEVKNEEKRLNRINIKSVKKPILQIEELNEEKIN